MRPQRKLSCYLNLQHLHTAEQNFLHMMTLATQKIKETHSRPDNNIEGLFKRLALVGSLNDQLDAVMNAWQWGPDNPENIYKPRHATGHDSRFDLAQIVRSEEEQFCQVVQLAIQQIQAVPAEDEPNFNNHFLLRYMVIGWITTQTEAALAVWDELTPPALSYPPSVRRQSEQPQASPPRIPPEVPMQTPPERSSKPPSKHHPAPPPPKPNTYTNNRVPAYEQSQGPPAMNHPSSPRHIRHLSSSHMEIAGHRMPRSLPAPDSQHHEHSGSHSIDSNRRPLKRSRNEEPQGELPSKSSTPNHVHPPPPTRTFRPPPPLPVLVRSPETTHGPSSPTRPPNHDSRSAHPDPQSSPNSTASTGSAPISQQSGSRTESRHPTRTNSTESTNQEKSAPRPSSENSGPNKSGPGVCKFAYPYSVRGAGTRTHVHSEEIPQANRARETRSREDEDRCQYENDTTPTASDSSRHMVVDSPPEQPPPDTTQANGAVSGSK